MELELDAEQRKRVRRMLHGMGASKVVWEGRCIEVDQLGRSDKEEVDANRNDQFGLMSIGMIKSAECWVSEHVARFPPPHLALTQQQQFPHLSERTQSVPAKSIPGTFLLSMQAIGSKLRACCRCDADPAR